MRQIFLITILMMCVACSNAVPTAVPPPQTDPPPTTIPATSTPVPPTETPAPTATPIPTDTAIPPTVTPTQLILDTIDDAINLLVAGWQLRATPEELRPQLLSNGWLLADSATEQWLDTGDAWIVTLGIDNWDPAGDVSGEQLPWDVVIIDDTGVQYRYTDDVLVEPFSQPARFVAAVDINETDQGTDQSELIMQHSDCGAHTCYDTYHVIQRQADGTYSRITDDAGMSNSYTDVPVITTFEGQTALAIHGGGVGSAGAGPYQRLWTSYWGLNPATNRIELAGEVRDESPYRFHALHDANTLFDDELFAEAQFLYGEIVNDITKYEDPAGFINNISTYDSTRQFAAFRLILHHEISGDAAAQANWINWLTSTYPDSMAAGAVPIFVEHEGNLPAKCLAVTDWLLVQEEVRGEPAAGTVADLGYQLPNLTADTFCPIFPEPQIVQFDTGGIAQLVNGDVADLPATYRFYVADNQPLWIEPQSEAVNIFLVSQYGYRTEPFYDEDGIWRTYTSGYPDYFDLVVRDSVDSAETTWQVTVTILPAEQ